MAPLGDSHQGKGVPKNFFRLRGKGSRIILIYLKSISGLLRRPALSFKPGGPCLWVPHYLHKAKSILICGIREIKEMKKKDLTSTAYHEAGHAVMFYATKKKFEKVSIIPGGSRGKKYLGIVKEAPIDPYVPSYNHHRETIIMMAGRIAESIYSEEAIDFSGCIVRSIDYGFGVYGPGETLDAYTNFMFHLTHDLVKIWWPVIEALAK